MLTTISFSLMQGIKVLSLSRSNIQKTSVSYPIAVKEQQLIAYYFSQLDNLITLHQRQPFLQSPPDISLIVQLTPPFYTFSWEQRKFSDVVATRRGLTYKPSDIRKNGVRVLRSSNIAEDSFTLGDEDVFVVREAVNIDCARANDILITAANGSSRLVGKHTIITGISEESAVHGGFMLLGTTKEPHFVNASMGSSWYRRFIELFVAGGNGAIGNLRKNDLDNQEIAIPSEEEQKIIGSFFHHLDNLITLHQRKFEKLTNVKKSMLEKMFPQNGSSYPEIRFKGFTDPWEQRKLGDVVQITMGQSPDGSTYSDEPSDYILVQGNADLQNGWVCPRIWTTQITKKADAGDLIMSVRAPAGAMGKTAYNAVIGRGVAAIKGNEFIYQLLVKMDADGFWKTLSCGSTFESLNSDNIKNAEVKIPTTAEQIKIGGYFQQLDNLITLHQRELEKLQNIKKSMLEKMFV